MNFKVFKRTVAALVIVVTLVFGTGCSCKKKENDNKQYYDNNKVPLVFSTQEVDGVFSPFFSTTGPDSNVTGMTQIGMLGNNKQGEVVYGDDEPVVTKDLEIAEKVVDGKTVSTTYKFVIKNNIKFSNGSLLSIKDVLFNLYVYLDPSYSGSSTIYSTDIVGLKEYRTQASDPDEQDNFNLKFQIAAEGRILALVDAANLVFDDHKNESISIKKFKEYLAEYVTISEGYANIVEDFDKTCSLFKEELERDYSNSIDSAKDIVFTDEEGNLHKNLLTTDVEAFLYNEGYITWNKKDGILTSSLASDPKDLRTWTKEQAINTIYADKLPKSIEEIVLFWNTSNTLNDFLVKAEMEEYFNGQANKEFSKISGIDFANRLEATTVNGKSYGVPEYNEDGTIKEDSYEVLSITIKEVDPKAIWNFAFTVAPMYYYSNQEQIDLFDFESHFGVIYGNQTFMNEVVGAPEKNSVPVGAGAYAASCSDGGITNIKGGDFHDKSVIYFERNPYFIMGEPKIKKVRFQVVGQAQMLNALYNGEVDFVEPNAKPETEDELNGQKDKGIGNKSIKTSGYGYIGINAGKVPDMAVRQAIMHTLNTQACVDYYKSTATPVYRSMSTANWAYPEDATPYYPFIGGKIPANYNEFGKVNPAYAEYVDELGKSAGDTFTIEEQRAFIARLVEDCGFVKNGSGIYQKGSHVLRYTFTIAGQETDHPAFSTFLQSSEILNTCGFQINVTTDANALSKLSSGDLTVWAAAWGSTIDPDMYQVYHKDSKATSTLNWGYPQIKRNSGGKYDVELDLLNSLSDIIELARKTNDKAKRKQYYSDALDLVMQLAIELPTYQRNDLYAYNTNKIDVSTLTPDSELSPFKGLTSDLHNVSLNQEK